MSICERMFKIIENTPGKTASGLCKVLGLGTNATTTWKNRNTDPPAKYIVRICEYLEVPIYYLLTGEHEQRGDEAADEFEESLLSDFRQLDARGKAKVVALAASEHERVKLEGDSATTAI